MKLEELILHGFVRLMKSNLQHVEYRPQAVLQLIIGSNGSGKSSIMDQLTPLPGHHREFTKGGYKHTKWTHRGSSYVLKSTYDGGSGHHEFIKDGENLNKGFTFAVQTELCFQEFGLDRKIHDILTGATTFTGMSTTDRRKWLTHMIPVDLTYVFDRFQAVSTEHRDCVGQIRRSTKRMVDENHDLPDDAEMGRMREEVVQLTTKLNDLFLNRVQGATPGFRNEQEVYQQLEDLIRSGKALLLSHYALDTQAKINSRAGYEAEMHERNSEHRSMTAVIEQMVEELEKARKQAPSKDANLSAEEIQTLRSQVAEYVQLSQQHDVQVQQYQGPFPLVPLDTSGDPHHRLEGVFNRWMDLLSAFPANEDGRMNTLDARNNKELLQRLKQQQRGVEDTITQYSRRLATLRGCAEVVCPHCTHTFKPGVDVSEVSKLESELERLGTLTESLTQQIEKLGEWLEEYDVYASFVYRFRTLVDDYPQFTDVWNYCGIEKVMFRTPRTWLNAAVAWRDAMQAKIDRDLAATRADVLRNKLQYVEAIDQDAAGYLQRLQADLEANIETRTHEALDHRRDTLKLQTSAQQLIRTETQLQGLLEDFERYGKAFQKHTHYLVQRAFEEETRVTQLALAQQTQRLNNMEQREHTLRELERDHEQAVQEHADLGLLVKALGPKDGLIGRYLLGFIQELVKLINSTIDEIWTYPMEVLPGKVDKDELDYNFPLDVNGGAVVASDIAKGSSSQRDIVNFAFKLAFMKALHFEDYPLHLDEFGSTFDEQHRENLIPFLARLIELGQVKQVFFISHYSTMHGAFNQADVFVLDPTNITVPSVYNQHVVLA
jgi:DNA repair exonuclease SbcCD ATPase subunit